MDGNPFALEKVLWLSTFWQGSSLLLKLVASWVIPSWLIRREQVGEDKRWGFDSFFSFSILWFYFIFFKVIKYTHAQKTEFFNVDTLKLQVKSIKHIVSVIHNWWYNLYKVWGWRDGSIVEHLVLLQKTQAISQHPLRLWITTIFKSSSRVSDTLFWPLWLLTCMWYTYKQGTYTDIYI